MNNNDTEFISEFSSGNAASIKTDFFRSKEYLGNIRTCQLCTHQKVCIIWSLFKGNIENKGPFIVSSPIINTDDLAKICRMYEEKKDQ